MWGTDAVHGHNNVVGATIFPHNIGLGATQNPALIREIGRATALEVLATGIDWTYAPTLAVAQDDRWGRTYESYGEEPELVRAMGMELVLGLQGEPGSPQFLDGAHVLATGKHFLADGGTDAGDDQFSGLFDPVQNRQWWLQRQANQGDCANQQQRAGHKNGGTVPESARGYQTTAPPDV